MKGKITFQRILKAVHLLAYVCMTGGFLCMLAILLTRSRDFTGAEVLYDKAELALFNTVVLYGFAVMVVTIFLYMAFTEWRLGSFPFLVVKLVLTAAAFAVGYFCIGSAISGMASISDAGFHMGEMAEQYLSNWDRALLGLWIEIVLLIVITLVSVYKPFGRREAKPFRYRKAVLIAAAAIMVVGAGMFIKSSITLNTVRNMPIADVDVQSVADGEYEGKTSYSNCDICVRVTVKDHKITKIEDLAPRDSIYATYATGVFNKIIDRQTPNVDAITGATTSSKAFMKAVEDALTK
jgi:uncharacterized protein with FMN-binding domain